MTATSPTNKAASENQFSQKLKDIWGCGQGIGAVKQIETVETLVARIKHEYQSARSRLGAP
jgi:nitronate monooxygenase